MSEQTTPQLTEYEIHDVLQNERRTQVLKHLQQKREMVTLRELSEQLAALETGEMPPPRNIRESVYNSLHQTHLPKLDRLNIIEYERDRKIIHRCERAKQVDLYMEIVPDNDVTWAGYYRALGALSLLVVTLASLEVPAFAVLSTAAWAGGFLGVFALSVLFQLHNRQWLFLSRLR